MLDDLTTRPGARQRRKRVGRGPGSGVGRYCGRGIKGQGKRSAGRETPFHFEGGQMPLARRLPKRGFHNRWAQRVAVVNVGDLEKLFDDDAEVNPETLKDVNLAKGRYDVLKVLGGGRLTKKLRVSAHRFSRSAMEKIQAAGGQAVVLPGKAPVVKNKQKTK